MQFEDHDLQDLIEICYDEFGERISLKEATAMAAELFALYELLAKPLPSTTVPQSGGEVPRSSDGT